MDECTFLGPIDNGRTEEGLSFRERHGDNVRVTKVRVVVTVVITLDNDNLGLEPDEIDEDFSFSSTEEKARELCQLTEGAKVEITTETEVLEGYS